MKNKYYKYISKAVQSLLTFTLLVGLANTLIACSHSKSKSTEAIKGITNSPENVQPLLVGTQAPLDTQLRDADGNALKLKQVLNNKPSIVLFYRGGWCPYCNTHLSELRKIEKDLKKLGVQILAISTDVPEELKKSVAKNKLNYDLYSDSKMDLSKAFGIAFKVDDETVKKYHEYGIDLEKASGETHHLLPVPAVFAIEPSGLITFTYVNPNYKVRLSPSVLLAVAKDLVKKK